MITPAEFKSLVESKGLKFVWGLQVPRSQSFIGAFEVVREDFGPILYRFCQDLNNPSWECHNLVFSKPEFTLTQAECMELNVLDNFLTKLIERPIR